MKRKEALALITETFWRMHRVCESTHEWDQYVDLQTKCERQHRSHKPEGIKINLSLKHATQLFAVRNVFACLANIGYQPQAKDFFSTKPSCFAAVAMAEMKRPELLAEFTLDEMNNFYKNVDYVELV